DDPIQRPVHGVFFPGLSEISPVAAVRFDDAGACHPGACTLRPAAGPVEPAAGDFRARAAVLLPAPRPPDSPAGGRVRPGTLRRRRFPVAEPAVYEVSRGIWVQPAGGLSAVGGGRWAAVPALRMVRGGETASSGWMVELPLNSPDYHVYER